MSEVVSLGSSQRRQLAWITVGALSLYLGMRWLPTGTNLSHMDFRLDPKAGSSIEFCDPANPQFIPVVAARSPVSVALSLPSPALAGAPVHAVLVMRTSTGKPVTPEDLLVVHTRRLHLLVVDPSLTDYQHVHPEPLGPAGEWGFSFTPRLSGTYRVFADFTPAATGRGLYASADLTVAGSPAVAEASLPTQRAPQSLKFSLVPAQQPVRANQAIDLQFAVQRADGAAVGLQPLMGAFAHLVAFDETRSGFAHLHPMEDEAKAPDPTHPRLNFKLTIPKPGRYVVWAQVNVAGEEQTVPFELAVQ